MAKVSPDEGQHWSGPMTIVVEDRPIVYWDGETIARLSHRVSVTCDTGKTYIIESGVMVTPDYGTRGVLDDGTTYIY